MSNASKVTEVYVVVGECGQYDGYSQWLVEVHFDKRRAEEAVSFRNKVLKDAGVFSSGTYPNIFDNALKWTDAHFDALQDRGFQLDWTYGSSYKVIPVPVAGGGGHA